MQENNIIKGRLLRKLPYIVGPIGNSSLGVTLNYGTGFKRGDLVKEEVLDNGIVLLIPLKIWEERENILKKITK